MKKLNLNCLRGAAILISLTAASTQAAVIISDPLTGTGNVSGSAAAVDTYLPGDQWSPVNALFPRTASGAAITAGSGALLHFAPTAGNVYNLEIAFADGAGSNGDWVYFGMVSSGNIFNATGPWMLMRTNSSTGESIGFETATNNGMSVAADGSSNHTLTMTLDTTTPLWSVTYQRDGTSFGTYNYTTNPSITYLTFGSFSTATATASNLVLTEGAAVPEPASLGLLALGGLALLRRKR